jgi:hypothetical protein
MVKVEKYIPISFTAIAIGASFFMTFINLPWFNHYNQIKYVLTGLVFIYVIINARYLKCHWITLAEKLAFVFYILFSFVASSLNLGETTMRKPLVQCVGYCSILVANCLLAIVIYNKGRLRSMLQISWWVSLSVMLISDLTAVFRIRYNGVYFVGDKFSVAYIHFWTLALLLIIIQEWKQHEKIVVSSLFFETILINIILNCATGLIGTLLFIILLLLYYKKILLTRISFFPIAVLLICALFPIWYPILLNNNLVQSIIENVLHKKLTLTGRTVIYSKIPAIFGNHILLGYGINTNYEICMRWGATNIQNGLMKVMMESGVYGALAFLILYSSIFCRVNPPEENHVKVFSSLLVVLSILSSIEITIGVTTISVLLYLSVFSNYRKEAC